MRFVTRRGCLFVSNLTCNICYIASFNPLPSLFWQVNREIVRGVINELFTETKENDPKFKAAQVAMGWTKHDEAILGDIHVVVQEWHKTHPKDPFYLALMGPNKPSGIADFKGIHSKDFHGFFVSFFAHVVEDIVSL